MSHEVARLINGKFEVVPEFDRRNPGQQMIEHSSSEVPDLAGAVDRLHASLNGMTPDDLSVSFTSEEANGKKRTSFQFRAYRR